MPRPGFGRGIRPSFLPMSSSLVPMWPSCHKIAQLGVGSPHRVATRRVEGRGRETGMGRGERMPRPGFGRGIRPSFLPM
jgi:hypothetical protein